MSCGLPLREPLQCLPIATVSPGLGTPRSPPTPLLWVRGHIRVKLPVPQKVIQESTRTEAFTVLNCGAGRRSVNAGPLTTQRGSLGCPANGTSTPGSTVLVTAAHKRAQEDANQDEWRFFSAHSTLIRAFHLLWPCASSSTAPSISAR